MWARALVTKDGPEALEDYKLTHNVSSIDGLPAWEPPDAAA